jgi:hypothetical protein
MRHDLKPFIFVINNSGYTVERAVLGKDAKYNDVANWRYSELPNVFSRDKRAETHVVQTSNELQKVLDSPHSDMVFMESVMDKYDAPIDLIVGGHALADSDYGVRGPQSAANAQIAFPKQHGEQNPDASAEINREAAVLSAPELGRPFASDSSRSEGPASCRDYPAVGFVLEAKNDQNLR